MFSSLLVSVLFPLDILSYIIYVAVHYAYYYIILHVSCACHRGDDPCYKMNINDPFCAHYCSVLSSLSINCNAYHHRSCTAWVLLLVVLDHPSVVMVVPALCNWNACGHLCAWEVHTPVQVLISIVMVVHTIILFSWVICNSSHCCSKLVIFREWCNF